LNAAYNITFDTSGHLWIAEAGIQSVLAYNVSPTPVQITADTITAGLNGPLGLAFNATGLLRVANNGAYTLTAYAPPATAVIAADTILTGAVHPGELAFDATGRLWATNQNGTVTAYAAGTGTPLTADTISGFTVPTVLAISP
jgi:lipoprotein-anchoring transpeptidase ErfK/SrfK